MITAALVEGRAVLLLLFVVYCSSDATTKQSTVC